MYQTPAGYGVVGGFAYGPAAGFPVKLDDFAGNATQTYPIGGNYYERIATVSFIVDALIDVADRFGLVRFLDESGVPVAAAASPFAIQLNNVGTFSFSLGVTSGGALNAAAIVGALPALFLPPAYSVELSVAGGGANDTVRQVRLISERFSTAPEVYPPGQGDYLQRDAREYEPVPVIHVP